MSKSTLKEAEKRTLPPPRTLGRHWLIELKDCAPGLLQDVPGVERIMRKAATVAEVHIVSGHFHQFSPYGVSGVLVIQESHLTIHTWPEYAYAAVDIFTCSPELRVREAIRQLQQDLEAGEVEVKMLERGRLE
ncbi:adenosylmethionine decarboxylase [Flavilitoribacter nigricans]|uniref:adenosylmethionine decarboxylase n=1 Tax=Flavilitoribacter nigricans TaxID=70997 RepID=UPI001F29C87E|nr:adenosylmethionine decarboxylase [Flavilitoribacter nigricans]